MKENIRYGFMVSTKPVEDYFDYVLDHGIDHLELDLKKKHSLLESFTPERISRLREFSQKNGISLSMHPPYNMNLCSRISYVRRQHVVYIKKCIMLAHQIGARYLTLHLGNFYRYAIWANPWEHAMTRLFKVLRKVLPDCERYGVCLALENMIPIPPEGGYSFLGDSVKDFQYIFSHINSRCLRFCLDIGHANTSEGPLEYVEKLGGNIIGTHFHDNGGTYDDHMDVGEGTVPWQELLKSFKKINFNGPYISECFKSYPHVAIKLLKAHF
jgi:sugar phosphate isomerase/epimerase